MVHVTDPYYWTATAMACALMFTGIYAVFADRNDPWILITLPVWLTFWIANIPRIVEWVMESSAYQQALGLDLLPNPPDGVAPLPSGFVAALFLFFAGIVFRESTLIAWIIFHRVIRPLIVAASVAAYLLAWRHILRHRLANRHYR